MSALRESTAWQALGAHARSEALDLRSLFAEDPGRARRLSMGFDELFLDYSKQRVTDRILALLLELARQTALRPVSRCHEARSRP